MLRREQLVPVSITLVQNRAEKRPVGPKEEAIEQFFDLGLATAVKNKDLHG